MANGNGPTAREFQDVATKVNEIRASMEKIEHHLEALERKYVHIDTWIAHRETIEARVVKLENWNAWMVRLVFGIIIAGLIAVMIGGQGVTP